MKNNQNPWGTLPSSLKPWGSGVGVPESSDFAKQRQLDIDAMIANSDRIQQFNMGQALSTPGASPSTAPKLTMASELARVQGLSSKGEKVYRTALLEASRKFMGAGWESSLRKSGQYQSDYGWAYGGATGRDMPTYVAAFLAGDMGKFGRSKR